MRGMTFRVGTEPAPHRLTGQLCPKQRLERGPGSCREGGTLGYLVSKKEVTWYRRVAGCVLGKGDCVYKGLARVTKGFRYF